MTSSGDEITWMGEVGGFFGGDVGDDEGGGRG